jgi:hypothetical protein
MLSTAVYFCRQQPEQNGMIPMVDSGADFLTAQYRGSGDDPDGKLSSFTKAHGAFP